MKQPQPHHQTIVTTREFIREFSKIVHHPTRTNYTIVRHGRPVGIFTPLKWEHPEKNYLSINDLKKLRFKGKEKNLSSRVDEIVYGAKR